MKAITCCFAGVVSVFEAEVMGVHEALSLVRSLRVVNRC